MKAICQVGGFQKIVEVDEPYPELRIPVPASLACLYVGENVDPSHLVRRDLSFRRTGRVGEFFLYEAE